MIEENVGVKQGEPRWIIDLDWYQQNNRSLATLAQGCLCPKCQEQLEAGGLSEADSVANIRDCCSRLSGFITGELTILESIFRLFLANGNEPLNLAELSRQLNRWLGGDTYRTSPEVLSRLLKDERYYGIRQVQPKT